MEIFGDYIPTEQLPAFFLFITFIVGCVVVGVYSVIKGYQKNKRGYFTTNIERNKEKDVEYLRIYTQIYKNHQLIKEYEADIKIDDMGDEKFDFGSVKYQYDYAIKTQKLEAERFLKNYRLLIG